MFQRFRKNIFSQNGEDGIILELVKRLNLDNKNRWCCEFGAWDGIHGSNTFNLVKNYKYKAVYIEGDKNKFKKLIQTQLKYPNIISINKFVDHKKKSPNSLDKILSQTKISKKFDILSIDIDSHDLAVWKSIKNYRPKIVIIEINSGILPGVEQIHTSTKIGNSFTSTTNFAKRIGYQLVCHTGNCIFIDKKYSKKIRIDKKYTNNKNLDLLFDYSWVNRKEFFLKKILKFLLPNKVIYYLRHVKNLIQF